MNSETKGGSSRLVPLAAAMTALATLVGAILSIPGLKDALGSMFHSPAPAASASAAALASGAAAAGGDVAVGSVSGQMQRPAAKGAVAGYGPTAGRTAAQAGGQTAVQDSGGFSHMPAADHAEPEPVHNDPAPADPAPEPDGE